MKGHDGAALIHVAESVARHDEEADAVDIRDSPQDDIRGEAAIVVDYGIDLTVLNHYDPGPVGSDGNPAVRQFGEAQDIVIGQAVFSGKMCSHFMIPDKDQACVAGSGDGSVRELRDHSWLAIHKWFRESV